VARNRTALRNRLEEVAYLATSSVIRALPREWSEGLGRGLGLLFLRVSGSRRMLVARNLRRAFPEREPRELERLGRDVFSHFGHLTVDLVRTAGGVAEAILERVDVTGLDRARRAYASGRGVFFLTAHVGNWETGAVVTSFLGMPMHVVARPLDNPSLDRRLRAFRESGGNTVVPKAAAAREMLRVLRSGGAVGILMDQHARPPDAAAVPFFGRPASTTTAVARFADRTGALVVPVTALYSGGGRIRLEYGEPLDVWTLPPGEREAEPLTARLTAMTEELVRKAPDQWLWLHNRWRLD
jgi:KDO2-lipid IV(A) lauroyltransferase